MALLRLHMSSWRFTVPVTARAARFERYRKGDNTIREKGTAVQICPPDGQRKGGEASTKPRSSEVDVVAQHMHHFASTTSHSPASEESPCKTPCQNSSASSSNCPWI